ncbi:MAG: right-handed parallel beta-helix repeat-containing protein [bacterium]
MAPILLPLLLEGATLSPQRHHRKEPVLEFSRTVTLPTRGVWYVWLKATNPSWRPALVTWSLDGRQPFHGSRTELLVPPGAQGQWLTYTRYGRGPGFKMQVLVEKPGEHVLTIKASGREGEQLVVDKVALTLHFGAKPSADGATLDHGDDPGGGRAFFPDAVPPVDGFRDDWKPPPLAIKGRSYHVDAQAGDDSRDGVTPATAWKSLARANAAKLAPGDALLLKRGAAWREGLHPAGNGTASAWLTVASYGEGARPRINGGAGPGFALRAQSYWEVRDLDATTDPEVAGDAGAIHINSGEGPQPKGIRLLNCVASEAGGPGIQVGCDWQKGEGYDGVVIENCLSYANSGSGIEVFGTHQNGCRNTVIRHCTSHSNDGMAGIWIESGQNGLIERCVSHNNAVYNIWCWNAINVTIRRCEAYRGRQPGAPLDSGGFDIDWGSVGCTIEYCYSHHNKGSGYLLMGSGTEDYLGFTEESRYNLCRYNVSAHDLIGLNLYNTFNDGLVHGNLVVADRAGWPAVMSWGYEDDIPHRTLVNGNVVVALDKAYALAVDNASIKGHGLTLNGNRYWRGAGKGPLFRWGGETWDWEKGGRKNFLSDLAALRKASGQEADGLIADPGFAVPERVGLGRLPLGEYRSRAGAPATGVQQRYSLDPAWLAARRKLVTDTGCAAYGIPLEPSDPTEDYWGTPLGAP